MKSSNAVISQEGNMHTDRLKKIAAGIGIMGVIAGVLLGTPVKDARA